MNMGKAGGGACASSRALATLRVQDSCQSFPVYHTPGRAHSVTGDRQDGEKRSSTCQVGGNIVLRHTMLRDVHKLVPFAPRPGGTKNALQ